MNNPRLAWFPLALAAAFTLVLTAAAPLRAEDRSAEVKALTEALQSNNMGNRTTALKKITNSGLTDRALFDLINTRLIDGYQVTSSNSKGVDEVAWMCKALASSGNPEYKATLAKVASEAPTEKVRRHAKQSLDLVDDYAERAALLSKQTGETEGLTPEIARFVNMLRAPDPRLKKDAAKRITRESYKEPRLYAVIQDELVAGAKDRGIDKDQADVLAWLCKALAASGDTQYLATLEQIASDGDHSTLRKYARQSADMLR